ncbi:cytochrome c biogenesis protein [Conexibacter sp. CPCC 206217]|uniref:cytochrome c biogenesis protein n=1 Tax=Conexibacter sp. CPCC 206217 TaxID=3064574 RepID=UPI002721207F|nr:cytochrome c biogenesis protein CcsA [Conexibacter sp. CPCC 206217]MDO8211533.1 cytochrome c biogenesis protein CcsA [Conexibacter sp. CPCC 206217]
MYGKGLRVLTLATFTALIATFCLVVFYAPNDADQGFIQKIFYLHVPVAIITLVAYVVAGIFAVMHLRTGDGRWDVRSYVVIHIALIFNVIGLLSGAIWAKASWGHWWVWDEPTLVSFLIVFLLYATYQPLRFSIEDPERQARYASVFAILAGAFVPLNFMAVRMATSLVHPRTFATADGGLPGQMMFVFVVAIVAMGLLFWLLVKYEITQKNVTWQLRALRRRLLGDDAVAPLGRSAAPTIAPEARP